MARSTEIMQQALDAWDSAVITGYAQLYGDLVLVEVDQSAIDYLLGSLERFIQGERIIVLREMWGPLDKATPEQAQDVTVPRDEMIEVAGLQGFYGVPRTFLFLYVHAYLLAQGGQVEPLERMRKIIDQIR